MENVPHVDMEALLRESRAIREEATRLMREFRLVEQFQQYGKVEPAGSYRWDLMMRWDLDSTSTRQCCSAAPGSRRRSAPGWIGRWGSRPGAAPAKAT